MKTKTNIEGNKYLFYENDYELEAVALRLISLLPKHSGAVGKPLKEQLWDCAFDLIETTPSNSTIFKRCQSITNETEGDRVFQLLSDVITNVVKAAKMENEKVVKIDFDINNTIKTMNGILVRYTTNGKFVALKTFTDVLIGNKKDIDGILKRINKTIDTITFTEFNDLVYRVKLDQSKLGDDLIKHEYKSIKVAYEDLLTEKGIDASVKRKKTFGGNDNWDMDIDLFNVN